MTLLLAALFACKGEPADDTGTPEVIVPELASIELRLHDEYESIVVASWSQQVEASGQLEYRFEGEEWSTTPQRELAIGEVEQLVLGVPYEATVEVRLVNDFGDGPQTGDAQTITTASMPDGLPIPEVETSVSDKLDTGADYILGCMNEKPGGWVGGVYWTFIMDRQGRVVWARQTPGNDWTIYCQTNRAGDELMLDHSTYWADWDEGRGSQIVRMKIDGTVVDVVEAPGLHHPFIDLPDGSIAYGRAQGNSETLERINPDGSQDTIWDCDDFHSEMGAQAECQSNSLWWHEETDTFLFSFFMTSEVVRIDHATGETLAAWGRMADSWDFDPIQSKFSWQHGPTITDEGTLLLSLESASYETEVREYEIDEDGETLHMVWSFGEGEGVHGETAGEAWRLVNGNTLHNYGSATRLREITPEGEVVWDVYWPGRKRLLGHTTFVEDLYALAP